MSKTYGDRWETVTHLSEGGQAHTYIVKDKNDEEKKEYVLKRLKNEEERERLKRFIEEIETTKSMNHKNIIEIIDHNIDDKKPYYVMEYCKCGNLDDNWEIFGGNIDKVFNVFFQICEAVNELHKNKVVHRDIKPENILVRKNEDENIEIVIADFGICFNPEAERVTGKKEVVAPRFYIPPELEDGKAEKVTPASDSYMLGKLLYWMLSRKNFAREKHREPEYDLSKMRFNEEQAEHINTLLDKLIIKEIKHRLQNAGDIKKEAELTYELIKGKYVPIAMMDSFRCKLCGIGYYKDINPIVEGLRTLSCDKCGNVKLFIDNDLEKTAVSNIALLQTNEIEKSIEEKIEDLKSYINSRNIIGTTDLMRDETEKALNRLKKYEVPDKFESQELIDYLLYCEELTCSPKSGHK